MALNVKSHCLLAKVCPVTHLCSRHCLCWQFFLKLPTPAPAAAWQSCAVSACNSPHNQCWKSCHRGINPTAEFPEHLSHEFWGLTRYVPWALCHVSWHCPTALWYRSVLIMPRHWQPRTQKDHWQTTHSPCVSPELTCPVLISWEVSRNHCISTSRRPCGHQGGGIQHLSDSSWLRREPGAEGSTWLFPGCMLGQEHCVTEVNETIQYSSAIQKKDSLRKWNHPAHFHRSRLIKELDWVDSADVLLCADMWTQTSPSTAKRLWLLQTFTEFSELCLFIPFEISLDWPFPVPVWLGSFTHYNESFPVPLWEGSTCAFVTYLPIHISVLSWCFSERNLGHKITHLNTVYTQTHSAHESIHKTPTNKKGVICIAECRYISNPFSTKNISLRTTSYTLRSREVVPLLYSHLEIRWLIQASHLGSFCSQAREISVSRLPFIPF